jgi:hypothetical protein
MGLEDIPTAFADAVGINEATAQVILSITIIFALLLPYLVLTKGKPNITLSLILVFLAECLLVGLGWMPFWMLIATVAMMAIAIASLGTGVVTGEG